MQPTSNDTIFSKVVLAVEQVLYLDGQTLVPATRLTDDLRLRRFDRIKLVIQLEEVFGLELADDAVDRFDTVGDIARYIRRRSIGGVSLATYAWVRA